MAMSEDEIEEALAQLLSSLEDAEKDFETAADTLRESIGDLRSFIADRMGCGEMIDDGKSLTRLPCVLRKGHPTPCQTRAQKLEAKVKSVKEDLKKMGVDLKALGLEDTEAGCETGEGDKPA